ncbi:hypothetical protein ACFS4T_17930 [Pseudomonas lini]
MTPVPKTRLVEKKPRMKVRTCSFSIPQNPNFRGYIINRRYKRRDDGSIHDLNSEPDVVQIVKDGGYQALHFIDFTAEGWVRAACPQLETAGISNAVAYSLVAAPDFFTLNTLSANCWSGATFRNFPSLFGQSLRVLSNTRAAGNPDLRGGHFQLEDKGITAIISHPLNEAESASADAAPAQRQTWLADAAAGSLSPGWEISGPGGGGPRPQSLCAYELGSPFTEDVRICASIGGYWPSVSPDNSRAF